MPSTQNTAPKSAFWRRRVESAIPSVTAPPFTTGTYEFFNLSNPSGTPTVDANGKKVVLHMNYTPDERWPERPVGYFLEDLQAGKYSVIRPAVDIWFAVLWAEIEQAVR